MLHLNYRQSLASAQQQAQCQKLSACKASVLMHCKAEMHACEVHQSSKLHVTRHASGMHVATQLLAWQLAAYNAGV